MQIKNVKIEFLGHSGFVLTYKNKKIAIDPFNVSEKTAKTDFILITHSHFDHCSIKDIEKISKNGTVIVVPADAQSKITKIDGVEMQIIESGEEIAFENFKIQAVPAYNLDKEFHPKNEGWIGYLIKVDNVTVYHAGDTDKIPEMNNLTGYGKHGNEFVALLPVSGTYVMDAEEAAEAAEAISPDLAIPMHYGSVVGNIEDAKRFCELCEKAGIKTKILEKS